MNELDLDLRSLDIASAGGAGSVDALEAFLDKAVLIRSFEDKVMELYMQGLIPGTTHLSHGHEAVSLGAVSALETTDYVAATYRGHHHALSVGVPPGQLFAEMMGRSTGNCRGMGGSTHAATDMNRGLMGTSLIIGAGIPIAVGAALGARAQGRDTVALCFFGDGATNAGVFHEALNMASLWKAPVVFVIENNLYAEYTTYSEGTSVPDLAVRALSYGMPGLTVDGQDPVAVSNVVKTAVDRARHSGGPTLIEAKTYRFSGHSRIDPGRYRPEGELERWRTSDPIDIIAARLKAVAGRDVQGVTSRRQQIVEALDNLATTAAEAPEATMEEALGYVFA